MSNNIKTVEKIIEFENHWGLANPEGESVAETLATRVVYDRDWEEYQVWVYTDRVRYPDGDYFAGDKEDALNTAKWMRSCKDLTLQNQGTYTL